MYIHVNDNQCRYLKNYNVLTQKYSRLLYFLNRLIHDHIQKSMVESFILENIKQDTKNI